MANDKVETLVLHPLIKAQEQKGELTIEFSGFVGTGDEETLRLYANLSMSSYVDIPKEGLVHVEQDPSEKGKVRAFVRADQKIREVNTRIVTAQASAFSATAFPATTHTLVRGDLIGCYRQCEDIFARRAGDIIRLRNRAEQLAVRYGPDSDQYRLASLEADEAENGATAALHQCIQQCRANQPYQLSIAPPVTEVVANISKKYLG